MELIPALDLGFEELEGLEAPAWWHYVVGFGAGVAVGGAALYGGIAIGIAIT
ncbi:daptide-type RiPP [Parafrankia discariae]|uniref:daptide-type RiPP n=1 Tax=Parafrankia discariae TaxID=365528 RepID=UPI00038042ED|nr:daptide-type RiPP [Parafrankia discariae]